MPHQPNQESKVGNEREMRATGLWWWARHEGTEGKEERHRETEQSAEHTGVWTHKHPSRQEKKAGWDRHADRGMPRIATGSRRARHKGKGRSGEQHSDAWIATEQLAKRVKVWVRDLTEEGIEPHPGPRYLSKNVNSVHGHGKLFQMLESIRRETSRAPITAVFIQDHRLSAARSQELIKTAKGMQLLAIATHAPPHPSNGVCYGGTMIVIPYAAIEREKGESIHAATDRIQKSKRTIAAHKGRYVAATMKVEGRTRHLVAAYAPATPTDRPAFFTSMRNKIRRHTVMGIDANCVPDVTLDLQRDATSPYPNNGADILSDTVDSKGLVDVAREVSGSEKIFSAHHKVRGGQCWSRIDQIYAPAEPDMQYTLTSPPRDFFQTRSQVEIDHILVDIQTTKVKPTKGTDLPYINETIFDNPIFVHQLHTMITEVKSKVVPAQADGWRTAWESIKKEARRMCLAQTKKIKFVESQPVKRKKKMLANINKLAQKGKASPAQIAQIATLKKEIRTENKSHFTLHKTLEREAYDMGKGHDRCTAEFFRPWKDTNSAQHIEALAEADWSDPSNPVFTGNTVRGVKGILRELTAYYKALFADKTTDDARATRACLDTLEDPQSRRVLPPTAAACGAPIEEEELRRTLQSLPTGKSPGPDRLPNKFYKVLASTIAPILTKTLNEGADHGALHPTATEGIISVLYKKKERTDPRNYRPITLLNGDYKILTRILTQRMNTAVLQFVSPQQNGFVPGGFLPENLMQLKLIQAWIEDEDEEAFLVFLDMEKAFDRCSWQYLMAALEKIGFDKNFINYVSLFYSHDHPPTRQLSMNGTLGPSFPLHSGVAQGCPCSPLLFLVVTEALTRLIMNDESIEGVTINGTQHKISQYADDSTLIPRNVRDWTRMEAHLQTWCEATAMKENATKREGQLLGKLNRQRARAPKGIIHQDKWVADGDSIRALGVPMGNALRLDAWWASKYREVKQRIAAWRSTRHMSITGRTLLLQAILYGSLRFWLFALVMHEKVIEYVESDAYHLVWASNPELLSNEDGTLKKSRAYIHKPASYLDQKRGGAGLPHFRSHIKAFYAQWIRRYLDPSEPPWKKVADAWIGDRYPIGRGAMLTNVIGSFVTDVPTTAPYLRACIRAFEDIRLKQSTSILDHRVAAESLFDNHRFELPIEDEASADWSKFVGLRRIHHLIDADTSAPFTEEDMTAYAYTHAPAHIKDTPEVHEWVEALMSHWPDIIEHIPDAITRAATTPYTPTINTYVVFMPDEDSNEPHFYAKAEDNGAAGLRYHIQFIDTFGTPHDTDRYVSTMTPLNTQMAEAVTWIESKQEDAHYTFQNHNPQEDTDDDTAQWIPSVRRGWAGRQHLGKAARAHLKRRALDPRRVIDGR